MSNESQRWQRHRAARVVALHATDAGDLVELLDMLGLSAQEGRFPPDPVAEPAGRTGPRPSTEAERNLAITLLTDVTHSLG